MTEQVQILADSRNHAKCQRCGQKVTWATTVDGRRRMFDRDPVAVKTSQTTDWRLVEHVDAADLHRCGK